MYYQEDELFHYGVGHLQGGHSGRYEWGSGDNPYQRYAGFMSSVNELKETGMSDTEIARALNMSSTEYRAKKSLAKSERRAYETNKALALKAKGYSNTKIGEMMGKNESSIRSLLDPVLAERNDLTQNTAQMLKDNVDSKGIIDIGAGVEREIGVSDTRLKTAVDMLKEDGYQVFYYKVEQAGNPGKYTTVKALATPDAKWKDAMNSDGSAEISTITDYMAEFMRELRKEQHGDALDEYFRLGRNLNQRDTIAVRKMVGGLVKLMYPDGVYTKEQLEEILKISLEMRRRVKEQLKKLGGMEFYDVNFSYIDIEDMSEGISIMDLGLNEFRLDLLEYVKADETCGKKPFGMHAVVPKTDELPEGAIFVLKNRDNGVNIDNKNRIHPFYMVYISSNGDIVCDYLNPKKLLDDMRMLCKGQNQPIQEVYERFNEETDDGRNMSEMSQLLSYAINSIIDAKEESDIDSLFSAGGTSALMSDISGLDDFELITFLVVR